ncbi:MAG: NTP transferase domain-containing protein [Phycisphaerales bacterium]|nr:NTP transferase domain-containing protein [Phycisphaerae bacterium]NNF41674.1 NTP transferase domain-containing protein [Phycisphaerales bacterium]NNM25922.1 NTP transferase domain-containing protein [Phycisphaerales bacterium]
MIPDPHSTSAGADRRPMAAIILAAGKGTRMDSDLPKVAHEVAGRPIVWWVVDAVRRAGATPIVLVVGYGADVVREIFDGDDDDIVYVTQTEQRGTGHATACATPVLGDFAGDVLVLAGDGPLIRPRTIDAMRRVHEAAGAAATLATSVIEDPAGYGRVIRDADGRFEAIVEDRNLAPEQRSVHEVYPSYACFDAAQLFATLERVPPDEISGEIYVTEVPAVMRAAGKTVELIDAVPPEDVLSINTPAQLAEVGDILTRRLEAGVP